MHRDERECDSSLYLLNAYDLCHVCTVDVLCNLLSVLVTKIPNCQSVWQV